MGDVKKTACLVASVLLFFYSVYSLGTTTYHCPEPKDVKDYDFGKTFDYEGLSFTTTKKVAAHRYSSCSRCDNDSELRLQVVEVGQQQGLYCDYVCGCSAITVGNATFTPKETSDDRWESADEMQLCAADQFGAEGCAVTK